MKLNILLKFCHNMVKAECKDYGYDCDFVVEGEIDDVVDKFGQHTEKEHGIEYSPETLTKFIVNKGS